MSKLDGVHWKKPERLGPNVNTKYWEGSCSLAPTGKTLYFSSERPGGFGGRDIYSSQIGKDGSWGPAHNLGGNINTKLNDDAPFIHPDGITLFFSSEGWNSMGGYDIFYSTYNEEDSAWNTPVNMGYPINSSDDDRYYVLTPDGDHGYFSSNRKGGYGQQDLYIVTPGYRGKPPVLALTIGIVTIDDKPVQAEIKVTDMKTDKNWGNFLSNSSSGKYIVALSPGTKYKISIEVPGLAPHIEYVDVDSLKSFIRLEDSIHLYTDAYKKAHSITQVDTSSALQQIVNKQMSTYFAKEDSDSKKADAYLQILNKYGLVDSSGVNYNVELGNYHNSKDFDSTKYRGLGKIISRVDEDGNTVFYIDSVHTLISAEKIKYKFIAHDSTMAKTIKVTVNNNGHHEKIEQFYHDHEVKKQPVSAALNDSAQATSVSVDTAKKAGSKPIVKTADSAQVANVNSNNSKKETNRKGMKRGNAAQPANVSNDNSKSAANEKGTKNANNNDTNYHLGNIYYDFNKSTIPDTAKRALDEIVKMMKANPCLKIRVSSFTDSRGTDEYNMKLSQRRANSAVEYLVAHGIEAKRIKGKGFGKTHLLNDCGNPNVRCSEEDFAINRRTEFKIYKSPNCK